MAVPTLPEHSTDISIIVLGRLQAVAVGLSEEVVSRLARMLFGDVEGSTPTAAIFVHLWLCCIKINF